MNAPRVRRGRRATPGVPKGVSEQAALMVKQAREAIATCENKMFGEMYAESIERKVYHNDHHLFNFMKRLKHAPVSIEEFLDGSEFLGSTDLVLWPEVRKAIIEINRDWWRGPQEAKVEAVLMGSTSSGKTEICKITTLYHVYLLSCIDTPQTLYGLPKTTSIVFVILAAKPHVTKKVIYMPMRQLVEHMPYFQKHLRPNKLVESEMIFEEQNIRIVPGGADADSVLGEAIIGGILDEINFMNVVLKSKKAEVTTGRSGLYDQAHTIHSTVTRRKKGRFISQGPQIGIICTSSSTRYKGDFTDKRKKQVVQNKERNVYIYDKPQYMVWPQDRYCGEKFRLLVGNDIISDTRILKDGEAVPEGSLVLDIPIEYLADFQSDPYSSLRDVCGISTSSISPFFKRRFKIYEAVDLGAEMGLESFLVNDNVILGVDDMPRVKFGHYCANPSRPRYVHIDLSTTGDRCVAEGGPVLMADGTYCAIEAVEVGDSVLSHDGDIHEVADVSCNGVKAVLQVTATGWGEDARYTSNHRMLSVPLQAVSQKLAGTTSGRRVIKPTSKKFTGRSGKAAKARYDYTPEYRELGTLQVGDFLATPRPRIMESAGLGGTPLNYATGYIAGLYAAEGSMYIHRSSEYVQFALHENETAILRQLERCLEAEFGVTCRICRDKRSKGVTVRTTKSQELVDFLLASVGEYSHRKDFVLWNLGNREFHKGFCHALVDGDGYVRYGQDGAPAHVKLKVVSKVLAQKFYWCLVAYGFLPVFDTESGGVRTHHGRETVHRDAYVVSFSGVEQCEKFRTWGRSIANVPCSPMIGTEDYILSPITAVVDAGECPVYDLTIADSSSFVVGNTAVHNCGIAMVRFDGMVDVTRGGNIIEKLPIATVELACSIAPDANNELQFSEVRTWVKQLRDVYGYPIKAVTYDGVFSIESIQQWRKQGMKTGHVSVDKTSVPYKQLRDTFHDGRLRMYHQEVLISEFFELEYDETKDKIDHPVTGSKDVADAVCGAYYSMLMRRASWTSAQMDDEAIATSNRAEFDDRYEVGARR